jgi:hypothetical protein
MELKVLVEVESLKVVVTKNGGTNLFNSTHGALWCHSTLLWIFYVNYNKITKGSKLKNYGVYINSNISHMKAYKRLMCEWDNWSLWHKGSHKH